MIIKRIALGALSLVAFAAGCDETKAKPPAPTPHVTVAVVARKDVNLSLEAVGNLDGYVNAEIRARVRGVLQGQRYKDGATVKQGQLLFSIDRAEYAAALDAAKAAVARAETAAAHNKAQLERRQDLGAARVVSRQELEDAEASARDANDQVKAAGAQLRQAELNVSYTEIRSPVTGIAGLAQVRVGNLVGQDGPTLLTTVSEVDPIRVNFPMSEIDYVKAAERLKQLDGRDRAWAEAQFKKMDAGQGLDDGLELVLADGSVYAHRGVIVAVNRQVDATTGTIELQALFPNHDGVLRPGQFGRVRMRRRDAGGQALVVPDASLVQVQGTYSLAVVGADGKVKLHPVEVGPAAGPSRIITSGVEVGDRVIVDGLQKAPDGATVIVDPTPPPTAATTAERH
ncbi:MAG TPA: efflux RND transporter periplasmic adaptor subunit [Polyangia bacterium]|nr:efflux RND transporter periplasmic adaptor subunit [Polyangia bacterium]